MTGVRSIGVAAIAVCLSVRVLPAVAQETSLSIYTDGRVLVRRSIPGALQRGRQTVTADLGVRQFDPTSLLSLTEGVEVSALNLVAASGQAGALMRAVGREMDFLVTRDSTYFVRATVLSVDPPAVRYQGRVLYQFPGVPAFEEDLVRLAQGVELVVTAAQARPELEVSYLADGLRWRATYAVEVPARGAGRATVTGTATLENPGAMTFEDALVQLVAGSIRRVTPAPRDAVSGGVRLRAAAAAPMAEEIATEEVGEARAYTLPERVSFAPGVTRAVPLIARASAEAIPLYALEQPEMGIVEGEADPQRDLRPTITYMVRRPVRTPFGDVPLPAGVARVYAADAQGRLQLLGEAPVPHTPAGRELRLVTGLAIDITAERVQMSWERRSPRELIATFRVTVRNAKDQPVTVEVTERLYGQVDVLSSTVPAERVSASSVRFAVPVAAGGESVLEYRARVRR